MGKRVVHPWTRLPCSHCGNEGLATRGEGARIDAEEWLCGECEVAIPLNDEIAQLRAEVERLRAGIRDLRQGLLRGLRPGDGTEPEPMTEVSGVVTCLAALVREDGAS